ncbi:MAG TPA: NADH-quinone oxidoreductase subunit K [Acidimicrobiales bacterium]|nr:NADH-quinone oxidoreductase subunit K [Acidimicrobiales bacterium]
MNLVTVMLIGVLFGTGTYLMIHRSLTKIVLGVALLGNGVNLLLLSAGGPSGDIPILGGDGSLSDALPQALVLTAIVIGFAIQAFLLALAWRTWALDGSDDVEDDVEDRRIAARGGDEDDFVGSDGTA